MQTDKLEDYIRANRNAFDKGEPVKKLMLPSLKTDKPEKRNRQIYRTLLQLAAAVLIFAMAWLANDLYHNRSQKEMLSKVSGQDNQNSGMPEKFQQTAAYYNTLIESRKNELYRLTSAAPEVKKDVNLELEELDKTFTELKADLKDNADNQEVIEAMIENYKLKLKILEDMLEMINTKDNKPNSKLHETNQIQL